MPELPEVETIRQAITPYIENTSIKHIQINRDKCRYAFDKKAFKHLHGFGVSHTERRGKMARKEGRKKRKGEERIGKGKRGKGGDKRRRYERKRNKTEDEIKLNKKEKSKKDN